MENGGRFAHFITLDVHGGIPAIARVFARIPSLRDEVARIDPSAGLCAVIAFGAEFWRSLKPGKTPKGLRTFGEMGSGSLRAPATGGDVFLHIHSSRHDLNHELATRILRALEGAAKPREEVHGFTYLDSRDLTGFIDGTANPKESGERSGAALIGAEDEPYKGGSYLLTQRYIHNLPVWGRLAQAEQERAIGRTKPDSEELKGAQKPPTAHISRVEIQSEDGEELKIVRHSLPYGHAGGEQGLFFLAYAKDTAIFEAMLGRMFGEADDGLHDRLMEFTAPVSGAFFFAPSAELLASLASS